ncbi:MAG TPA: hypothetical protein VLF89_10240 [Candidatus Saccharimonadales bacterium]|nr:hypothetical protein [Candidatus Saccharimonadales bacterium]
MNNLSTETRNQLKIGVLLLVIIFFVFYGVVMYFKYTSTNNQVEMAKNNTVVFKQPTLTFFSQEESLSLYPDRISIHYPYLIVVRPDAWKSEIYNFNTKKQERIVNEVLLDYFNNNSVYNKQGFETYFNKKSLGILCDRAFIKSATEVLCVYRPDKNKQDNKLISINTQDLTQKDLYSPQNVITAIYYNKDVLYVGGYDFATQKASIMVNNMSTSIEDLVNVIYPINNKFYAASFKSLRNNKTESYYEVTTSGNNVTTKLVERGKIVFYK